MTPREQAAEVYGKLYIDEHGDVTTKERDIAVIAASLADARRAVLMEIGDECRVRAYAVGMNEPLRTNHMREFLEWIRAKAQEKG